MIMGVSQQLTPTSSLVTKGGRGVVGDREHA